MCCTLAFENEANDQQWPNYLIIEVQESEEVCYDEEQ
jgi:hypothetical protein